MNLYAFFVLSFLSVPAFAANYIVGGQDVTENDPVRASTVGVFSPSPDGHSGSLCTGTLLRKNIVLTAAHCVSEGASKAMVIFNRNLHSPAAEARPAEGVEVNSKYGTRPASGMDQGDIALVKFGGALPEGYKKVSSVRSDSQIKNGSNVTLAGYGISNAEDKSGAGRLRKTQVSVLDSRPGKSEMILDQSRGRGACHGDSGGPAYITHGRRISLAGVTNRGYPNTAPDDCVHQVVYTKVPAYKSWIQKGEQKLEEGGDQGDQNEEPMLQAKSKRALMRKISRRSFQRGPISRVASVRQHGRTSHNSRNVRNVGTNHARRTRRA